MSTIRPEHPAVLRHVARTTAAQGLPSQVDDPVVLARVAGIVKAALPPVVDGVRCAA